MPELLWHGCATVPHQLCTSQDECPGLSVSAVTADCRGLDMLCSAVSECQDTHWVRKQYFDLARWYLSGTGDKVGLGRSASAAVKKWHCFQESQTMFAEASEFMVQFKLLTDANFGNPIRLSSLEHSLLWLLLSS